MDVRYLRAVHASLVSGGVPEQARGAVPVRVARQRTRTKHRSCTSVHGEVGRCEPCALEGWGAGQGRRAKLAGRAARLLDAVPARRGGEGWVRVGGREWPHGHAMTIKRNAGNERTESKSVLRTRQSPCEFHGVLEWGSGGV